MRFDDAKPSGHFGIIWRHQIVIFIQVVTDAYPCPSQWELASRGLLSIYKVFLGNQKGEICFTNLRYKYYLIKLCPQYYFQFFSSPFCIVEIVNRLLSHPPPPPLLYPLPLFSLIMRTPLSPSSPFIDNALLYFYTLTHCVFISYTCFCAYNFQPVFCYSICCFQKVPVSKYLIQNNKLSFKRKFQFWKKKKKNFLNNFDVIIWKLYVLTTSTIQKGEEKNQK